MKAIWVCALVACGGPKRPPETSHLQGQEVRETPGAPPLSRGSSDPVPGTKPDTPTGDAAKRDAELAAKVAPLVDAFSNDEPAFTRDGKRVAFISDRDGLPQLYVASLDGPATRVTSTKQRVTGIVTAPGGSDLLFMSDTGADENWSIFRVGLDGKNLIELTAGEQLSRDIPIIPDGRPSQMLFTARSQSSAKSTVYSASATAPGPAKALFSDDMPTTLQDVGPRADIGILIRSVTSESASVLRLDLGTGKATTLYPTDQRTVSIRDARLTRDARQVLVATDDGAEQSVLLSLDATTGKQLGRHPFKPTTLITGLAVAREGGAVAVSLLAGVHSEVVVLDARTLAERQRIALPTGTGYAAGFSNDGKRLIISWSTPETPNDLFVVELATGKRTARREPRPSLTSPPAIDVSTVDVPAFDGLVIPTNVYLPKTSSTTKHPVIVAFHGGPAGASPIRWNARTAFFTSLGYAVVEPNVRGSAGFGRAFEAADNGPKRLDAFKDIETVSRWVASQAWADKERLVVMGGSYGGYTTLIALSRWPEIWRAGIDMFGVVDLESLLTTTSGDLRQLLSVEFGDPVKDAGFLASISPITDVGKIVDPLFVYAGANDPRVPRAESDTIVKALRGRKIPVEYMVAANEGHSLDRRENQLALLSRVARFLETALR